MKLTAHVRLGERIDQHLQCLPSRLSRQGVQKSAGGTLDGGLDVCLRHAGKEGLQAAESGVDEDGAGDGEAEGDAGELRWLGY